MRSSQLALVASAWVVGLALSAAAVAPTPNAPENRAEDEKHGAVLCSWAISLDIQYVADRCYPGQDPEFRAALSSSISRMETFIERNGGWTPEDIQRHHSSPEREFEGRDVCKVADVVEMYQAAEAAGPAATKKGTDELLAVPREPEMDPCL